MGLRILSEQIALYNKTNDRPITQQTTSREGLTRITITIPKVYRYE